MADEILFELCFDESIILTEETLVMGNFHPETLVCQGTVDIKHLSHWKTR